MMKEGDGEAGGGPGTVRPRVTVPVQNGDKHTQNSQQELCTWPFPLSQAPRGQATHAHEFQTCVKLLSAHAS